VLHLEYYCVRCWKLETSERRSEVLGKILNVVLEKDEEDQLDRSCEKWSVTESTRRGISYRQ
jgi:methylphosphotriester-DNA--protein-cysteine methyltransferase